MSACASLKLMEDVEVRLSWSTESECSLYSRSEKKWCDGQIVEVLLDEETNAEWMVVRYGPKQKRVQRFCADLKPIEFDDEYRFNDEAMQFIIGRLRATEQNEVC